VYYSRNHRLDKSHVERLKGDKRVNIINVDRGGHNVVRALKESGELNNLLKSLFEYE